MDGHVGKKIVCEIFNKIFYILKIKYVIIIVIVNTSYGNSM